MAVSAKDQPLDETAQSASDRIVGYDLARALAILGMVLVHFMIALAWQDDWQRSTFFHLLDGRAAALFVILAGVGLSLRARGAGNDRESLVDQQRTILRRGLFLLVAGYVNLIIWPGDILRVYGVSLLLAPWLLRTSTRRLWLAILAFIAGFMAICGTIDYSRHWDWESFTYHDLDTFEGAMMNLFYNGFRSVFPWTGVLLFGLWLGRLDVARPAVRHKLLVWGLALAISTELLSWLTVRLALADNTTADPKDIVAVFGTGSMPPLPLFLLAAGSASVATIGASLALAARFPNALAIKSLADTGRMAFTWYVAHIMLGLGTVEWLDLQSSQSLGIAVAAGFGFFLVAVVISWFWFRIAKYGPLEWLMRRVAG